MTKLDAKFIKGFQDAGATNAIFRSELPIENRIALNEARKILEDDLYSLFSDELKGMIDRHLLGTLTVTDRSDLLYEASMHMSHAAERPDAKKFVVASARALLLMAIAGENCVGIVDALANYEHVQENV